MIKKSSKLISGLLAFAIYFAIIGLLLFYFNTREKKKSVHYVKKDEHRIQVALSAPKKEKKLKVKPKSKPKPKQKSKPKIKSKSKKEVKKKILKKKVAKKSIKKVIKKQEENLTKSKKKKTLNLFANVKTSRKKNIIKVTDEPIKTASKNNLIKVSEKPMSASARISSSIKVQKNSDSGVENDYLAKVQSMLEDWPAQNEYAGEKIKVVLFINPSGSFEFELKVVSANEMFNTGLTAYLEQLQSIGFGRHKGKRTYEFEAEFIAKE